MACQQVAVLAHPAEAATYGPATFQNGRAVYKATAVYIANMFFDIGQQLVELLADDVVIVGAPGVLSYVWRIRLLLC